MKTYVDATALAAYYGPHARSREVEATLRACEEPGISRLSELELCAALGAQTRRGELAPTLRRRVLGLLGQHLEKGVFELFSPSSHHYRQAARWLASPPASLSLFDALHLAVAAGEEAALLTLDPGLRRAAEILGIATLDLETGSIDSRAVDSAEAPGKAEREGGGAPWAAWEG